jgi:hypothetical protein
LDIFLKFLGYNNKIRGNNDLGIRSNEFVCEEEIEK